jgi:hypothetical protein
MGAIAEDVAAFEADMDAHLARLNADVRWGGDALTLAEVDAAGEGDGRDYANLALMSHLLSHARGVDGVFPVDGACIYLAMVKPYGRAYKEYYGTAAGRALVRALLDVWRMTDEEGARADKARQLDKAGVVALSTLFDVHRALIELRKTIACGAFDSAYGVADDIDTILADNSLPAKRVSLNEMIDLLAKVAT